MDFASGILLARSLKTLFKLLYEATKQVLRPGTTFSPSDFVCPLGGTINGAIALLSNVIEPLDEYKMSHTKQSNVGPVIDTSDNECIRQEASTIHLL